MLALCLAAMPVVWTGTGRNGVQLKLNRDQRGLVVQEGSGRKASKTRLKAAPHERVAVMESLLGGAPPAELGALLNETGLATSSSAQAPLLPVR